MSNSMKPDVWIDGWCSACGAPETEANEHHRLVRVHRAGCPHERANEHPAVALLRDLEWSGENFRCPCCRAWSRYVAHTSDGPVDQGGIHAAGCRLAAILAGTLPDAAQVERAAVEDARREEREACAQIADRERESLDPEDDSAARHSAAVIAESIRARGAK